LDYDSNFQFVARVVSMVNLPRLLKVHKLKEQATQIPRRLGSATLQIDPTTCSQNERRRDGYLEPAAGVGA